jgi:hypothetical protein
MSTLRPECRNATPGSPCPPRDTAYFLIRESVAKRRSLAWGAFHRGGLACAVGTFFDDHPGYALPRDVIDEVAAVNDSYKNLSEHERWKKVNSWLRWKIRVLAGATST